MKKTAFLRALAALSVILFLAACTSKAGSEPAAAGEENGGAITLSPESAELAGLKTARAELRTVSDPIKAFGLVTFDPRLHHHLTARVPGRIEEIFAFEGTRVAAGQKILTLYSPDFLTAQSELLQMLERQRVAERNGDAEERKTVQGMLDAAEKKLRFLGLTEEDVRGLRDRQEVSLLLPVRSPIAGLVSDCPAVAGNSVESGTLLVEISNLRTVRVEARVFEKDIARVEPGLRAEVELAALPGQTFGGTLTVVGATVDETARTGKAIIEVPNPAERLKPGMSASVTIFPRGTLKILAVPESAVRKVEGRDVVFIARPGRTFVPREVKVGRTFGGLVEVLAGLAAGEEVAAEGSLALKSELLKKNLEGD
jgi:cobalt-zinc-cadmium efflux system membrane fusion protein